MGTKKRKSKNIKDHSIKKNDIVARWNNGKIETSVQESVQANSKNIGIRHALDILGESPPTIPPIISAPHVSHNGYILPPRIELETILEPAIQPPRMWNITLPKWD
jgi:hypothetical protein